MLTAIRAEHEEGKGSKGITTKISLSTSGVEELNDIVRAAKHGEPEEPIVSEGETTNPELDKIDQFMKK